MDDRPVELQSRRVKARFWLDQFVWLRVRTENVRGQVEQVRITPNGIQYLVLWEDGEEMDHYESQLATEFVPDYGTTGEPS